MCAQVSNWRVMKTRKCPRNPIENQRLQVKFGQNSKDVVVQLRSRETCKGNGRARYHLRMNFAQKLELKYCPSQAISTQCVGHIL